MARRKAFKPMLAYCLDRVHAGRVPPGYIPVSILFRVYCDGHGREREINPGENMSLKLSCQRSQLAASTSSGLPQMLAG